jgi:hypothetical protein
MKEILPQPPLAQVLPQATNSSSSNINGNSSISSNGNNGIGRFNK